MLFVDKDGGILETYDFDGKRTSYLGIAEGGGGIIMHEDRYGHLGRGQSGNQ